MLIWVSQWSQFSASKHAWLNTGEGEGTFRGGGGGQCEVEISGFFQKIREKRCLFQRFLTSIVGPAELFPDLAHTDLL